MRSTLLLAGALFAGCPAPATWTTPRTIPEGAIQHVLGVEAFEYTVTRPDSRSVDQSEGRIPFSPAYAMRLGLSEMLEVGAKVWTGAMGVDLKVQALRSHVIDVAFDPGFSTTLLVLNRVDLPVLVGINAARSIQLVVGPRASYFFPLVLDTPFLGFGFGGVFGVRLAVSESVALHIEGNYLADIEAGDVGRLLGIGVGFSWGSQPDYR